MDAMIELLEELDEAKSGDWAKDSRRLQDLTVKDLLRPEVVDELGLEAERIGREIEKLRSQLSVLSKMRQLAKSMQGINVEKKTMRGE